MLIEQVKITSVLALVLDFLVDCEIIEFVQILQKP